MAEVPATDIVVGQTYRVLKYKPGHKWVSTYIGKCRNISSRSRLMEFSIIQHVQGEQPFHNSKIIDELRVLPNPNIFYSRFFTLPTAKEISTQVNNRTARIEQRNVQDAIMAKTGLDFVSVYGMTKGMLGKSSKTPFNPSRRLPTKAPSSRERDPHPSPATTSSSSRKTSFRNTKSRRRSSVRRRTSNTKSRRRSSVINVGKISGTKSRRRHDISKRDMRNRTIRKSSKIIR
jgi:hypothetical protein